ncbi:FkbM family methyltransferase [Amorphus sp. 3PC139-8]|uniref:FkbM family methyltransferase n=1 Tax=Amorphus sp. 3PC139-8 TaxID=2735676 RepID=UPI00345CFA3B
MLDIGGNRGQSIDAVRLFMPKARIVSFEPNPLVADELKRLYADDRRVEIRSIALGNRPGELSLYIPYYNGWMFDGLASLDKAEAENWLSSDNLAGFDRECLEIRSVTCEVATLDDLMSDAAPVFVKIDVQGFEANVLDGGRMMLERARPVVMTETRNDVDMLDHLPAAYMAAFWDGERMVRGQRQTLNTFFLPETIARHF